MAHLPLPSETARTVARLREVVEGSQRKRQRSEEGPQPAAARRQASPARRSGPRKSPRLTPAAAETDRVLKRLRQLLTHQGKSFREAARIMGRPRSTLHSLAVRYRIKHRPPTDLSPRKSRTLQRLVREAKLTGTEISAKLRINKSTVTRAFARRLDEETPDCDFRPKRVRGKRCPVHGVVRFWPCVACAATSEGRSG